jgi:hypothetical protein
MDFNLAGSTLFSNWTFHDAVWLFPPAFTLHVCEEWPRFTAWARQHASPRFTQRDYDNINLAGIVSSVVFAAIVWRFPNRAIVFLFFTFVFAPGTLFNALFHAGATVLKRQYCPGVITALAIYLPLFLFTSRLAWREQLLAPSSFAVALLVAVAFHMWEVGHNVFKAW